MNGPGSIDRWAASTSEKRRPAAADFELRVTSPSLSPPLCQEITGHVGAPANSTTGHPLQ